MPRLGGTHPCGGGIDQYVNDRPYAATSLLSVALGKVFSSVRGGQSKDRPELAALELPLDVTIAALPSDGGEDLIRGLFTPLGYQVDVGSEPLDVAFPAWGVSRYHRVHLRIHAPLADVLTHLTGWSPEYWCRDIMNP